MCADYQLPQPRNLLFIEPQVAASNPPSRQNSPSEDVENTSEAKNTKDAPLKKQNNPDPAANLRRGQIGLRETDLPGVHAEPAEYYGGAELTTRARTFSSVSRSPLPFSLAHRSGGFRETPTTYPGRRDHIEKPTPFTWYVFTILLPTLWNSHMDRRDDYHGATSLLDRCGGDDATSPRPRGYQ